MQPNFLDSYDPAQETEIKRFEAQIGWDLTPDYRQFLMEINGGCPQPEYFFSPAGHVHEISFWYGLDFSAPEGPLNLALRWMVGQLLFRSPSHLICIGRSQDGNLLLLSLAGPDLGTVYFWLHDACPNQIWDKGPDGESLAQRLTRMGIEKMADSLSELLAAGCSEAQREAYFEAQLLDFESSLLADKPGQSC